MIRDAYYKATIENKILSIEDRIFFKLSDPRIKVTIDSDATIVIEICLRNE